MTWNFSTTILVKTILVQLYNLIILTNIVRAIQRYKNMLHIISSQREPREAIYIFPQLSRSILCRSFPTNAVPESDPEKKRLTTITNVRDSRSTSPGDIIPGVPTWSTEQWRMTWKPRTSQNLTEEETPESLRIICSVLVIFRGG